MVAMLKPSLIIATMALIAGMAFAFNSKSITNSEHVFVFEGPINSRTGPEIRKAIASNQNIDTIKITSDGGDANESLSIGEMVRDRHIDVVASKFCTSGCAQNIWLAGRHKYVEPGSVVAFHNSTTAQLKDYERSDLKAFPKEFQTVSLREYRLYQSLGLSPELLSISNMMLHPKCIILVDEHYNTDPNKIGVAFENTVYSLNKEVLETLGVHHIIGEWPNNKDDFIASLTKNGYNPAMKVEFVTKHEQYDQNLVGNLHLPICNIQ